MRFDTIALLFLAVLFCRVPDASAQSLPQGSQDNVAQPNSTGNTANQATAPSLGDAAKTAAKRRDIIRFGIDSEVLDLLSALSSAKNGDFNDDLLALFNRAKNPKLRTAVLSLFSELGWKGAEHACLSLVEERDLNDPGLVVACVTYLAAIKSSGALALLPALLKENDKKLLPAIARLMGSAGGKPEEEILLSWFDSDSYDEAMKQEAIKALGAIGSTRASEKLAALVIDASRNKATRMMACDALAKIKDPSAIKALIQASITDDPNVRTTAVDALSVFNTDESKSAIIEALRDSFVKTRISACKAIAALKISTAIDFLRYKAQNDPEVSVRTEAYRSLAVVGGDGLVILRERLDDLKENDAVRALCFGLLARYDAAASLWRLENRLKVESVNKERALYTLFAREIANATETPGIASLARILLADKDFLIRVAAIEWARKNRSPDFRPDLEHLVNDDPSDMIKKRAAEALASY